MKTTSSNIVHQYFKKEANGTTILLKVNPIHLRGIQIQIDAKGGIEATEVDLGPNIIAELREDGFAESSPLEFNLYMSGLAG